MHIPSQFYYSASQSSVCHSRTPTGNLAIKELIAGQPCWVLPTLPRIDKQKKLILADWTASNWSHKKINDVKTRLGELIEQGFDIYIWQAGQVIPMRTDLLARSELYTMSMASVDEVTQAAMAQHKLTYDEIQVIDDYWLNHLVNDTEALAPRVLRISEISVLKPEAMDKLVVMLNKATPELSAIINDIYSTESTKTEYYLDRCRDKFSSITMTEDYKILEVYLDGAPSTLDSWRAALHSGKLTNIERFVNNSSSTVTFDPDYVANMLRLMQHTWAVAPNLKEIDLNWCQNLDGAMELEPGSLAILETIDLVGSNMSAETLGKILAAAPNLKTISLNRCQKLDVALELEANSLSSLEAICLGYNNLSVEDLKEILAAAPNLKTISLNRCQNLDGAMELEPGSLAILETIDLSGSNISVETLSKIIAEAPSLKDISLCDCQNLDGAMELEPGSLAILETIDLSCSNISAETLSKIIAEAPSLKDISLCDCENLDGAMELEPGSLAILETIDLVGSNISAETLGKILAAAPNLKNIRLNDCENLGAAMGLEPGILVSFETIDLDGSNISAETLNKILAAAPNLTPASRTAIEKMISDLKPGRQHNPTHNPSDMQTFTPNTKDFQFTGTNTTKNQGMLIDKLCQYLKSTTHELTIIPKIQDGICSALSHYFLNKTTAAWDEFINKALAWNGQDTIDPVLSGHFNAVVQYIQQYQIGVQGQKVYIGDNLDLFSGDQACMLFNPWHGIAIKPAVNGRWQVYDPNYVTGYQEILAENLVSTVHTAIGKIVSVEMSTTLPSILDPDNFIENGGLLALCGASNAQEMLDVLPGDHQFSENALNGLFLRSVSGRPAWSYGIASDNPGIQRLTKALKKQFETNSGQDAAKKLADSLAALTPAQQGECITRLVQLDASASKTLISAIITSANRARYEKAFTTWDKTADNVPDVSAYCWNCTHGADSKRLIELDSTQHVDTLQFYLQQTAISTSRPVFYIDNPDDLICSSTWMQKQPDGAGVLRNGPGGALYDFLTACSDKKPLLIINYERFNADDMVRFNALLDKKPNADGTPLPADTQIIGLINRNKPDCYTGSDFYSRFNRVEKCPLSKNHLDECKPKCSVDVLEQLVQDTTVINLYNAPDWEERLLGRWELNGDALTFIEGQLIRAINAGKPIEIQNGLWGDPSFERFWQQVLSSGYRHAERTVQIPAGMQLTHPANDSYDWDRLKTAVANNDSDGVHVALNPSCLGDFMGRYEVEGNKLVKKDGFILGLANSQVNVNVTRTLTKDAWAMLLDECLRHQVQLNVHCSPGVEMPAEVHSQAIEQNVTENFEQDIVIISTDMDTSIEILIQQPNISYEVIDVSECTAADLLLRLDGCLNKSTMLFEFSQKDGALTSALQRNKHIILKGQFSSELQDALAPLLLSRRDLADGQIVLVTHDSTSFEYISNRCMHSVTTKEKLDCLKINESDARILGEALETESLSQLAARRRFIELHPDGNSDDAHIGMKSLPGTTQASTAVLERDQSAIESDLFTEARIKQVNEVLDSAPYVFLTGLSGVGKSTFVEKEFCTADALYLTEDRIQDWVSDTSVDKRKILFIDEANLSPRQWSEFEGLFNRPPTILVNGELHTLTLNHRVIFAGNPVNYGDERKLAPFFQRHGNAVLFTPLPPMVIYEKILKPVFAHEAQNEALDAVSDRILDVYRFVCACSTTEVLISPRELQMMALLTLTRAKQHPEQDINDIAAHFIHVLARNLVPAGRQVEFDLKFPPTTSVSTSSVLTVQDNKFLITPSREVLSQQLDDLLNLRKWRRESSGNLNENQKVGGLGGIIIEGAPGIGKSELVVAVLLDHGYTEEHDMQNPSTADNPFYRMPVSMPLGEKEALLIKAFNEGAVVMIDEMNSSPMMERLLNDLLMGKNPRSTGEVSVKPGFMVIGTQNPVTMAGRRMASTALQRRVITTVLPKYTSDELTSILCELGITHAEACSMVQAYEAQRAYAIKNDLSPAPNPRNLIELATNELKGQAVTIRFGSNESVTLDANQQQKLWGFLREWNTDIRSNVGTIQNDITTIENSRTLVEYVFDGLRDFFHLADTCQAYIFNIKKMRDIEDYKPWIKPSNATKLLEFIKQIPAEAESPSKSSTSKSLKP